MKILIDLKYFGPAVPTGIVPAKIMLDLDRNNQLQIFDSIKYKYISKIKFGKKFKIYFHPFLLDREYLKRKNFFATYFHRSEPYLGYYYLKRVDV